MSEKREQAEGSTEKWRSRLTGVRARVRRGFPFVAGVLATLVALVLYNTFASGPKPLTQREVNETVKKAMASATPPPPYSVYVNQAIRASLILIETDSPLEEGVGNKDSGHGLGSGVVINDKGDILTSLHVVESATDIKVTFADGTESSAVIIASQPENDIAVLSALTPPEQIVPATLGNPGSLRVGDETFAVGNPLGLYGSMSAGVISGLNRTYAPKDSEQRLEGLIQFDAAVNPGSSGGPLLNRYGQVIGIVTALVNPSGQDAFSGIGFAVPINTAGGAAGMPPY